MPLVPVDVAGDALCGTATLNAELSALGPQEPVVVMIHGFKYAPRRPGRCPHATIFGLEPPRHLPRVVSWPRHLQLDRRGLGIGFGWDASGALPFAHARAAGAGRALARLLTLVEETLGRPAHVVAHSLGARVALQSLRHLRNPRAAGRFILIAPAELRQDATAALDTPCGRAAEIVTITSRENDLFDALYEWGVAPHRPGARSVGSGLGAPRANWVEVQMDQPETLAALSGLGYRIAPAAGRVCHWSGYLRPGMFGLYRAILDGRLDIALLRDTLPHSPDPRWARLLGADAGSGPLRPLRRHISAA